MNINPYIWNRLNSIPLLPVQDNSPRCIDCIIVVEELFIDNYWWVFPTLMIHYNKRQVKSYHHMEIFINCFFPSHSFKGLRQKGILLALTCKGE